MSDIKDYDSFSLNEEEFYDYDEIDDYIYEAIQDAIDDGEEFPIELDVWLGNKAEILPHEHIDGDDIMEIIIDRIYDEMHEWADGYLTGQSKRFNDYFNPLIKKFFDDNEDLKPNFYIVKDVSKHKVIAKSVDEFDIVKVEGKEKVNDGNI